MRTPNRRPLHLAAACALALTLAACGGESDEKLLASAKTYLQKADTKAAVIQLKTLLQQNPKSGEGRLLLGKALRDGGDAAGSLVELRKAQELGVPDEQVLPELARTMLMAGESAKLVGLLGAAELKEPKADADLAVSLGTAFALQGDRARAQQAVERALRAVPGLAPAVLLQARLKAQQQDHDGALQLIDEVLQKEPKNVAALLLKGDVLWQGKKDRDAALVHFRSVVAAEPRAVAAHVAIVTLLFEQQKVDAANAALAELVKIAPEHPDTVFLQARSALLKKDFAAVRELTGRLLKRAPDNPLVLELAGLAEMSLRADVQAEAMLARAVKGAPQRLLARQALARVYLRQNDPDRALATLQPVLDDPQPDGQTLAIAGEALLQKGELQRADEAFARAAKASPGDAGVRTSAAMAQLARGDAGGAAAALESVVASDETPRADLALVAARMRQNDVAGALKAIDGVRRKLPTSPLPDLLTARVLVFKKDTAGARSAYEAALQKDSKYFPAVSGLAALDLAAGQPDAAKARLEALAKADPRSYQARLELAELTMRHDGAPAEVTRLVGEAVKAAPTEPRPRVLQVSWLLRQGDPKGALAAAQDAAAALPDNADVLLALGGAQLASGDAQQALSTFRKVAGLQPRNAQVQLRLADASAAGHNPDGARAALRQALELSPDLMPARRGLARLAVADKRYDEAVALAREAQKRQPKSAAGFLLEGEIEASRKAWPAAIAALRAGQQREKTTEGTILLHRTLAAAGQGAEADRVAADWLKDHPKDAAFIFHLGDAALARNNHADAEKQYRAVLALQPTNVMALNNVAWILANAKRPGAVAMAEQALKITPESPPVLDTLALALAAEGQLPKAIETQKRALQKAPADPGLKLTLAKLYVQSGDKLQARGELEALQRLGEKFAAQDQVAQLLKSVQ